jgi:hypothetical protein
VVGTGVQILELWACLRTILRLFSLPLTEGFFRD